MSREILALQMHPMQKAVTGEELYKAVEQALVTATCQVSRKETPPASVAPLSFMHHYFMLCSALFSQFRQVHLQ